MSDNRDFFFCDYVSEHVRSFSIGDVWLYFYKETMIAVRDLETARVWVLNYTVKAPEDGYSHRHEIAPWLFESVIFDEPYPVITHANMVSPAELVTLAIELASQHIVRHVDVALAIDK